MPIPSHEKLNYVTRLINGISQTKAQLQQAQTEQQRAFLNKKIRVLEAMLRKHASKLAARRETARASKAAARWKRMNGPR